MKGMEILAVIGVGMSNGLWLGSYRSEISVAKMRGILSAKHSSPSEGCRDTESKTRERGRNEPK